MKLKSILCLGFCAALSAGLVSARTWTSADGAKTFDGDLKSYDKEAGKVTVLMRNGKALTFSTDKLSDLDQEWLKEQPSLQDAAANREELEAFKNSELGKALKDLKILEERRFKAYEYESPPEYYILYFTASW